jgi:electron transfer flavoprotein beta subunit
MRILVSLKVVPDLDLLRDKKWTIKNNLPVETAYVKKIINTYDESALELTLKMADHRKAMNLETELFALTIGEAYADLFLKNLLALGFTKTYRVNSDLDLRFNPEAAAMLIASFTGNYEPFDLLIMGMQSSDGDNAKTALLTAEELAWPCISGITNYYSDQSDLVAVESISDQGLVKQTVRTPCILAVGNAPGSLLRVPTLKAIKKAAEKDIRILTLEELNAKSEDLLLQSNAELQELETVDNNRESIIIEGASAEEKAHLLYENYLKGWLSSK